MQDEREESTKLRGGKINEIRVGRKGKTPLLIMRDGTFGGGAGGEETQGQSYLKCKQLKML